MKYPTLETVRTADREQLARWHRFLPSPGLSAMEDDSDPDESADFDAIEEQELAVMAEICARFEELGGWSPELSKSIGHALYQ